MNLFKKLTTNPATARSVRASAVALGATSVAVAGVMAVASPAMAAASGTVNTDAKSLNVHSAASTGSSVVGSLAKGAKVSISCQTTGSSVTGKYGTSTLWDKIGTGRYVTDTYIYTGSDGRVAPDCTGGSSGGGGGGAQTPTNDYAAHVSQTYGFAYKNCTAFAAYRVNTRDGVKFQNDFKGQHFGNAGTWDDAARRAGLKVDTTPKVGALAVNDVHKVGHVAYINKVNSDGSFNVEEYNWNVSLGYGTRTDRRINSAQDQFQHIVHF